MTTTRDHRPSPMRAVVCSGVVLVICVLVFVQLSTLAQMESSEYDLWWNSTSNNMTNCNPVATCCLCEPQEMGHCCIRVKEFDFSPGINGSASQINSTSFTHCMMPYCGHLSMFTWVSFALWFLFLMTATLACCIMMPKARNQRPRVNHSHQFHTRSETLDSHILQMGVTPEMLSRDMPPAYEQTTDYWSVEPPVYATIKVHNSEKKTPLQ
jgi:hypothetical protein